MDNLTISTTPSEKKLYAVKYYEGSTFPLPYHSHERYELTLILEGSGVRFVGDSVEEFSSGDIVLIGPHLQHKWQIDKTHPSERQVKAITIFFEEHFPTFDLTAMVEFSEIQDLKLKAKYGVSISGQCRTITASRLQQMLQKSGMPLVLLILQTLYDIAISKEYNTLSTIKMAARSDINNQRIQDITKYISDNLDKNISLEEVSHLACMHKNSIGRFFKKSTGFSVIEYANLLQLGKACQLLIETEKKISSIAFECGFDNLSYFNRIFKKNKSITPQEYRESRKGLNQAN